MKSTMMIKFAAIAAVAMLAGCQDLKPLQAEVDGLKSKIAALESQSSGTSGKIDAAAGAAASAGQAAASAQTAANQALAASQASQSCCDATNEKIDRMFKRSVSK